MAQRYDVLIKQSIIKRIFAGERLTDIAVKEGIPRRTLYDWSREQATPEKRPTVRGGPVLCIPDMHHPFAHPDALDFLRAVRSKFHPSTFVCLGDEVDFHSFSRYVPDPDGLSPGAELEKAIEGLIPFYREFPEMMVCESNHTIRPMKKMWEAGIPASFLPSYSKMLRAPDGWRWSHRWEVDGVLYHHGDAGRSGQFAPAAYMKAFKQSHVHGHIHGHACVMYEGAHFGMNAGCLIDPKAYAFKYAKNAAVAVNLGCGLVFDGKAAHFLPMHLDSHGRWTGRL